MVSEWFTTTLGNICALQGGSIQTGPFGSQLHASDYKVTGTPVVMPANIGDGRVVEENIARIHTTDADRLSQHKLQCGDIVLSRRGDVTRNALVGLREEGWLCGTGCLKVRLGDERHAQSRFIAYYLRSPDAKEWLVRHAVGATMPNLNTAILSAVPVLLPPLSVQDDVTSILSGLDDKIALLRETNATLEAIAQAIFKSWFVDFDPVRAKAEGREPEGMPPEIAELFPSEFEDSELGEIPKGWQVKRLDQTCEISPTRRLSKGVGASYLEMAKIPTQGHRPEALITRTFSSGTKFINGDTLLARITPCLENGKTAFVDFLEGNEVGWGSTEYVVLRTKPPLPHYWAYLLCRHMPFRQFAIQAMVGTSGRQRIEVSRLAQYSVVYPDRGVANAFAEVVELLRGRIAANDEAEKTLSNVRDSILPRLMSGKLRLADADLKGEVAS